MDPVKPAALRPPPPPFDGLGLSFRASRGMLVLFIVVHGVLAFLHPDPRANAPAVALAYLAVCAAAIWLARPASDPMPRPRTAGILVLCAVTAGLMWFQTFPAGAPPFAQWHLGAITLVLLVLALRGRPGWAWGGYAVLAAVTIGWALANGLTANDGVGLVIRHAGTLLAGSLFAFGLRRSARRLAVLNRELTARAVAEAGAVAAIEERKAHLARISALARPALVRLAGSVDIDEGERAECLLVEASLRDAIRGRALFVEPLITEARAARARGVDVTLLDDSGDQPPAELAAVHSAVATELVRVPSGLFTARVLPADRPFIATIVIESAEHRMLVLMPDGEVREA